MVRRKHSPKFKAMVAIEVIKGEKTISQIASEYGIQGPVSITNHKVKRRKIKYLWN